MRRVRGYRGPVVGLSVVGRGRAGSAGGTDLDPDVVTDAAAGIAFGDTHPAPRCRRPPRTPHAVRGSSRAIGRHTPPTELAADVVGRMTLREKLGEIVLEHAGPYENINAGVPRLCIPALTLQDGPQGVAYGAVGVTQLPAPLGVAATFDTGIAEAYGQVQGSEAAGQGIDVIQGPTLNIDRVPQSGRTYEGFGEDPVLVSAMGVADAEGIQTDRDPGHGQALRGLQPGDRSGRARRRGVAAGARGAVLPALQGRRHPGPRLDGHVRLPPAQRDLPVPGPGAVEPAGRTGGSPASSAPTWDRSTIRWRPSMPGTDLLKPARR